MSDKTLRDAALLPCPFCGGEAEFERVGTPRHSTIVTCCSCGARHESGYEGDRAALGWNERAALAAEQAQPEVVRTDTGNYVIAGAKPIDAKLDTMLAERAAPVAQQGIARALRYPEDWDTAAYPTLGSAVAAWMHHFNVVAQEKAAPVAQQGEAERLRANLAECERQYQAKVAEIVRLEAAHQTAVPLTGLVSAIARKDDREVLMLFDTNEQANEFVRLAQAEVQR